MKLDKVVAKSRELANPFRFTGKGKFRLKDVDPGDTGDLDNEDRPRAKEMLQAGVEALTELQDKLYAQDRWSLLLVFQAMDAAGKDGAIKHVMSGVNPQGCQVFAFKRPSDEDLDHNFLWRYSKCLPERGRIGIFNRSYYEETLIVRVHPEVLDRQKLPPGKRGDKFWAERYDDINRFERHLTRNGTLILKVFLNVSKKEQKKRFLERLDTPEKQWKFSLADLEERKFWDDYQRAFEDTITHTSTKWAPWWVVPADNKWVARSVVSAVLARGIKSLGLKRPEPSAAQKALFAKARRQLLAEK